MVKLSCERHDALAAASQFVTHLTGRLLSKLQLQPSPIATQGFKALLQLVDNTRAPPSLGLFCARERRLFTAAGSGQVPRLVRPLLRALLAQRKLARHDGPVRRLFSSPPRRDTFRTPPQLLGAVP